MDLTSRVFGIKNQNGFLKAALGIFNYQVNNNPVYRNFLMFLGKKPGLAKTLYDIPFLPVEFFRNQKVIPENLPVDTIFESSRTTGTAVSRHYIHDIRLYEESFTRAFRFFYGDPSKYLIAALLPSYTERGNSSLIYMMNNLIKKSMHPFSGFYKDNTEYLISTIRKAREEKQNVLLLGVSFALLDLAEKYSPDLSGTIIMETGGMKGKRKEITRQELHLILKKKFNVIAIHSEYGMTELLSQAYSKGDGIFYCPPWMRILIRDPLDPLSIYSGTGKTGGINIIDLANIYSCSFIATGDLGRLHDDGGFEILGRFDTSDIRGCNLLIE